MSDGDISLATNSKFRSFKRKERRLLLELLQNCGEIEEDMLRHKNKWIRIGERLHPSEYNYDKINVAFRKLRNSEKIETFGGKVVKAIETENYKSALSLLKKRAGELARKLDYLLRISTDKNAVINTFKDVASGIWYYDAVTQFAAAGIINGYEDGSFGPYDPLLLNQCKYLVHETESAMVAEVKMSIEYTASNANETIRNKTFSGMVTIDCDDQNAAQNGLGGEIFFENCKFQGGLTALVGAHGYGVNLGGAKVAGGITVSAGAPVSFFNTNTRAVIRGVAGGESITAAAPVEVSSFTAGASFTLNGVQVTGMNDFGSDPNQQWFDAAMYLECFDMHPIGDHSECTDKFATLYVGGKVASISIANDDSAKVTLAGEDLLRIVMFDQCWDTVNLHLGYNNTVSGSDTRPVRITGGVYGSFAVDGSVNRQVEVTGRSDITQLAVPFFLILSSPAATDQKTESGETVYRFSAYDSANGRIEEFLYASVMPVFAGKLYNFNNGSVFTNPVEISSNWGVLTSINGDSTVSFAQATSVTPAYSVPKTYSVSTSTEYYKVNFAAGTVEKVSVGDIGIVTPTDGLIPDTTAPNIIIVGMDSPSIKRIFYIIG
jgi:hypothetical protein